jgi:hypothetical protein
MSSRASKFLTARWHHLVLLNYTVDPEILQPLVPAGTELDTWRGRSFVSMVGFQFLNTRVLGVPIPFHINFDEVNLRFYVRREASDGNRRGVVFVKEIGPKTAIAWVARRVYNENYVSLPMRHFDRLEDLAGGQMVYEWKFGGRWNRLAANAQGAPYLADEDSEESFISEHYWGYARQRDDSTVEYQVEHPRWKVWRGIRPELDIDVSALYGPSFAAPLSAPPSSAFIAVGSEVTVRSGVALEPRGRG